MTVSADNRCSIYGKAVSGILPVITSRSITRERSRISRREAQSLSVPDSRLMRPGAPNNTRRITEVSTKATNSDTSDFTIAVDSLFVPLGFLSILEFFEFLNHLNSTIRNSEIPAPFASRPLGSLKLSSVFVLYQPSLLTAGAGCEQ